MKPHNGMSTEELALFWALPLAHDAQFARALQMPPSSWHQVKKRYNIHGVVIAKRLYFRPAEVAETLLKNAKRRGAP